MKKYIILCLLYILCITGESFSQTKPQIKKYKAFTSGERLKYKMRYGFLQAGEGTVEVKLSAYKDKTVFHARIVAQTKGVADKLFRVKDVYESYFDTKTCLPDKAIRDIREGNYTYYDEVFYNHNEGTVYSQKNDSTFTVPEGILDMVSTLYYLRSLNIDKLQPGGIVELVTFFADEIFPFKFRFKGTEIVKTKFGNIKCYRFDPVVEPGRIFKSEDDMSIWISADQNLVPILVKFDMLVSSLRCELDDYSNLKYDLIVERD